MAYISRIADANTDLHKALQIVGLQESVKSDSVVFVKPNLTYPIYRPGVTTNPQMLKSLLLVLKDTARTVIVGESDGGNRSFSADSAFEGHGLRTICNEAGAELVNLSRLPSSPIEGHVQKKKVKVILPNLLLDEVDCLISMPVLKVHAMTGVSLSMKNLWGCYPDTMRGLHHKNLDQKLALITKVLKPMFEVIDGSYALDEHGPLYGVPRKTELLMCANNPVLADALGASILGIPLDRARHILVAHQEKLGPIALNSAVIGNWKQYQMKFAVTRTPIDHLSTLLFRSEILAKAVMDSPLTPILNRVADLLRNPEEDEVSSHMGRY